MNLQYRLAPRLTNCHLLVCFFGRRAKLTFFPNTFSQQHSFSETINKISQLSGHFFTKGNPTNNWFRSPLQYYKVGSSLEVMCTVDRLPARPLPEIIEWRQGNRKLSHKDAAAGQRWDAELTFCGKLQGCHGHNFKLDRWFCQFCPKNSQFLCSFFPVSPKTISGSRERVFAQLDADLVVKNSTGV